MTDAIHPDDELISAYLDGEASAAEIARIESSPEMMARAEDLAEVSSLVSSEVRQLPSSVIDNLIDRAIADRVASGNVVDMASARRRRIPKAAMAVAAGVVVLALAVPAIRAINLGSSSNSTSATAALPSATTTQLPLAGQTESPKSLSQSSADIPGASAEGGLELSSTTTAAAAMATADAAPMPYKAGSRAIASLPAPDPTIFDPLPTELPPMTNLASLREHLTLAFSVGAENRTSLPDAIPTIEVPPKCGLAIDHFLDGPHSNLDLSADLLAVDIARATVDNSSKLIVLIRDSPINAVALVLPLPSCTNVILLEISP